MQPCANNSGAFGLISPEKLPQACAEQSTLSKALTIFFVTLGAIAFLMLVIAGIRYIFSRGNPEKTVQAKNTIIYSVIGLIIAASAAAMVSVVLSRV